jgi:hypothetical protein
MLVYLAQATYKIICPKSYNVDLYGPYTGLGIYAKWLWVSIVPDQSFMAYNNSEGQLVTLYYNLRWKDNKDTVWQSLDQRPSRTLYMDRQSYSALPAGGVIIDLGVIGDKTPRPGYVPDVDELDFQAEVIIGYYVLDSEGGYVLDSEGVPVLVGQSSGWSDILTFNMIEQSSTVIPGTSEPSFTLSSSPDPPDGPSDGWVGLIWGQATLIILLVVVIMVVVAAALVMFRKNRGHTPKDPNSWL